MVPAIMPTDSITVRTACPVPPRRSCTTTEASGACSASCPATWPRAWPVTTIRRCGASSRAVASTWPSMVLPQTTCRTFGVRVFIRVPSPAARMMTAAGPLALTRLLDIGAGKAGGSPAGARSGSPQDTARPGGPSRDLQSRGPGLAVSGGPCRCPYGDRAAAILAGAPAFALFCQRVELLFEYPANESFAELREQAIALRRAGRSRREIRQLLAIGSNATLNEALRGEPPQPWALRPNAARHDRESPGLGCAGRVRAEAGY